jgi:VanZ family protein
MKRKVLLGAAIVSVLLAYATVSLWWGTAGWQARGAVVNAAQLSPDGGVRFPAPGIAFAKGGPAWSAAAKRSHRLELSLSVRSFLREQEGPARILTLSPGPYARNLTIGQQGADLILRLRTARMSSNGMIDGKPVARVPGVFLSEDWVDIDLLIEPGRLRLTVGGELGIDDALPPRPFATWDPSYRLALGNEIGGTRPWLGEIRRAAMRAEGHLVDYAKTDRLYVPTHFQIAGPAPKLMPLVDLNRRDAVNNVLLYVPLGVVLGYLLNGASGERPRRILLGGWLFIAAVSVSMELLQFLFVPGRWPSVDDVIFNALGGGIGLLAGPRCGRRPSRSPGS